MLQKEIWRSVVWINGNIYVHAISMLLKPVRAGTSA